MKALITTPTPSLENSLEFYSRLEFTVLSLEESNQAIVSDGMVHIQIDSIRTARAGIKFYKENWADIVDQLKTLTPVHKLENGWLLADASGSWIYLIHGEYPLNDLPELPQSVLGNYAGLSLEVISIERAMPVWQALGFQMNMGSPEQGWITMQNEDDVTISLMNPLACPHLFFNPSLTYFNSGNNLENIQKIREAGIEITEEITAFNTEGIADNVILRDPGGYGFFIFND